MSLRIVCLAFLLSAAFGMARNPGSQAEYVGGTRADIPLHNDGVIQTIDDVYFVFISKQVQIKIPYERIDLLEYGQNVNRRYISAALLSPLFLLSKKREHFLTLGFQDDGGRQQALIFRIGKNDVRATLVSLEARTGQRVEYKDDDARKSGKS